MRLISKIQLGTYEAGEFSEEQPRSLEETLALIEAFPWQETRQYIHTREGIKPVHPENKTICLRKDHFVHDSSHSIHYP